MLPSYYGNTSTNAEVYTLFPFSYWVEPNLGNDLKVTVNEIVHTNSYDQILLIEQTVYDQKATLDYSEWSTDEIHPVTLKIDDDIALRYDEISHGRTPTTSFVRYSSDPYYEYSEDPVTRPFWATIFDGYSYNNMEEYTDSKIVEIAFDSLDYREEVNVYWREDYSFSQIGHRTDTFRYRMSGTYFTNNYEHVHPDFSGTIYYGFGDEVIGETLPTDLNAMNTFLAQDHSDIEDAIAHQMNFTNESQYTITGTYTQNADGLILDSGSKVSWTIPGGTFDTSKIHLIKYVSSWFTESLTGRSYATRGEFFYPSGSDQTVTITSTQDGREIKDYVIYEIDVRRYVYTTQEVGGGDYLRNVNCWAYGLDMTPFSPWNSTYKTERAGTLISRDCFAAATHFKLSVGSTIKWITADNEVIEREIVDQAVVASDLTIWKIDQPVPSSISHCLIMPSDWREYSSLVGIAGLRLNQMDMAVMSTIMPDADGNDYQSILQNGNMPGRNATDEVLRYELAWDGDSGNSFVLYVIPPDGSGIADARPIILWCHYSPKWGPNLSDYVEEIRSAMEGMNCTSEIELFNFEEHGFSKSTN